MATPNGAKEGGGGHPAYWYGDAFARRGFVVVAVDVSHRDHPDDPSNGNGIHPEIVSPEMVSSDWEQDGERVWDAMRGLDLLQSLAYVDKRRIAVTGLSMGGEITSMTAAFDLRISSIVTAGFSPDLGVMRHYNNCPCWRWTHAPISEYIDMSDFFSLIAPRPLVIETGIKDNVFSTLRTPFASDKQIAYRTRMAYACNKSAFLHFLHEGPHVYRVGDTNAAFPNIGLRGISLPIATAPEGPEDILWQQDASAYHLESSLFDWMANSFESGQTCSTVSPASVSVP